MFYLITILYIREALQSLSRVVLSAEILSLAKLCESRIIMSVRPDTSTYKKTNLTLTSITLQTGIEKPQEISRPKPTNQIQVRIPFHGRQIVRMGKRTGKMYGRFAMPFICIVVPATNCPPDVARGYYPTKHKCLHFFTDSYRIALYQGATLRRLYTTGSNKLMLGMS